MIKYTNSILNKFFSSRISIGSSFNSIQDGGGWGGVGVGGWGGQKDPPTSFSPVISTNVGISPKNVLTFSFNPLPHWCKIPSLYLVPVPNHWTWTKTTPRRKRLFWSNPYKIEVVITSLIEMPQLPNFGHMNTSTIWFESRDKILLVTSSAKVMTS